MTSLLALSITAVSMPAIAQEASVARAIVKDSVIWPSNQIPVCWINPTKDNRYNRLLVERAIAGSWSRYSAVEFTGWRQCTNYFDEAIRIMISDEKPHTKGLGTQVADAFSGMVLNFEFKKWNRGCAEEPAQCIQNIAIHEFGHALGFADEQTRTDTPRDCWKMRDQGGNFLFGRWDRVSVMNQCRRDLKEPMHLSQSDKNAMRYLYGEPTVKLDAHDEIDVGDFDGDGQQEILIRNKGHLSMLKWDSGELKVIQQARNHIGYWTELGRGQRGYTGDFNGDGVDELIVRAGNRIYAVAFPESPGMTTWTGNIGSIGDWVLHEKDQLFVGKFNSTEKDQLIIKNPQALALYTVSPRRGFTVEDVATTTLRNWRFHDSDRILVSKYRHDDLESLYIRSDEWVGLISGAGQEFINHSIEHKKAGRWPLRAGQRELAGDFDGDGKSEIYVRTERSAAILDMRPWSLKLAGVAGRNIDGWSLQEGDKEYVGRFSTTDRDEILIRSDRWIGLVHLRPRLRRPQLKSIQFDTVDGWRLNPGDRHYIADLDGDGKDEIVVRSDDWIGVLRWSNGEFRLEWIAHGSV